MNVNKLIYLLLIFASAQSLSREIPFSLLSGFGNSGRASVQSAEYHTLNPAVVATGTSRATGLFFFNQQTSFYAGSFINNQQLPFGVTWWWDSSQKKHQQIFSLAGRLNSQWWIGVGVDYYSSNQEKVFQRPHIGTLYQPIPSFMLALTGHRFKEQPLQLAMGFRYLCPKYCRLQTDVVYDQTRWSVHGGVELVTKNAFSLRLGQQWPNPSYRIGFSLISFFVKLDYTWIQNEGHSFGVRVQSYD